MRDIVGYLLHAGCPEADIAHVSAAFRGSAHLAETYFADAVVLFGGWGNVGSASLWNLPRAWKMTPAGVLAWGKALGGSDLSDYGFDIAPSVIQKYLRAGCPVSYVNGHPFGLELHQPDAIIRAWNIGLSHTDAEMLSGYHISFIESFFNAGVPPEYAREYRLLDINAEFVAPMYAVGATPSAVAARLAIEPTVEAETLIEEIAVVTSFYWNEIQLQVNTAE